MRKSDFVFVDEEQRFPIEVVDEAGQRSTVLVAMSAKVSKESLDNVLFDKDGLAYMPKKAGSRLLHDRTPQYDLDPDQQVRVTAKPEQVSYFPALLFDPSNLTSEAIGRVRVRFLPWTAGEPRLLSDEYGNTYAARPDGKPGVVLIEGDLAPAPAEQLKAEQLKAVAKKAETVAVKTTEAVESDPPAITWTPGQAEIRVTIKDPAVAVQLEAVQLEAETQNQQTEKQQTKKQTKKPRR